jgi:hypothetical protein
MQMATMQLTTLTFIYGAVLFLRGLEAQVSRWPSGHGKSQHRWLDMVLPWHWSRMPAAITEHVSCRLGWTLLTMRRIWICGDLVLCPMLALV